jgi:hypothetical protein
MNVLLSVAIVVAGLASTDRVADRIAIAKTVAAHDFDGGGGLWSEVTPAKVVIYSIGFLAPDTALLEGSLNQYGSAIAVRRQPVRIRLRKSSGEWRISSVESP